MPDDQEDCRPQEDYRPLQATRADPATSLAVVIVTYNSSFVLSGLLDSLPAGLEGMGSYEVIVVDNDSSDDSVGLAAAHPTRPKIIRMGFNAGYAAGINAATSIIAPDTDVLILNPDIRLLPGTVRLLSDRLGEASVGVVVPKILDEDGTTSRSLRREPSMKTAWADALLGFGISIRMDVGEIVGDLDVYQQDGTVDWASGAILLVAARARRAVGDWDESFFLYSEEVDYLNRVRRSGFSVAYVAQAPAMHIGGDYLVTPWLSALLTANRIRYYRRHHGGLSTMVFRLGIVAGEALRIGLGPEHRASLRAALTLSSSVMRPSIRRNQERQMVR